MNEFSAQTKAAMATRALLVEGPQRASDIAELLYDGGSDGYSLLGNLSEPLKLVNVNGWWYVLISPFADVHPLLDSVTTRLEETPERMAYCRPLPRADMVRIQKLLLHLLKIGQPPLPNP